MKIYNVWTIIEVSDDNDAYKDLNNEQILVGRFTNIEDARNYQLELRRQQDEYEITN